MCTYFRFRIYAHMWQAVNHALCKANICLWSTLSNSLSVWMSVWMYLFCLLCMYNMSMYICIRVLSTVGTGALICCIIVLYLLCWIKKRRKKKRKKKSSCRRYEARRPRKTERTGVWKMYCHRKRPEQWRQYLRPSNLFEERSQHITSRRHFNNIGFVALCI